MSVPAMSALPPKSPATVAPFSDALGYRVLGFDKKSGDRLEMLRLRPQLASSPAFEAAVRERQRRLADFRHAAYARVRQIDRPAGQNAALGHRLQLRRRPAPLGAAAHGPEQRRPARADRRHVPPAADGRGRRAAARDRRRSQSRFAEPGARRRDAGRPRRHHRVRRRRRPRLARPDAAAGVAGLSPGAAVRWQRGVHPGLGRLSARLSRPDAGERPLDLRSPVSAAVRDAAERRRGDRRRRPHAAAAPGPRQLADARPPPRRPVRLGDRRAGVARRSDCQRRARRHAGRRRRLRDPRRRRDRRRAGHDDQHGGAAGGRRRPRRPPCRRPPPLRAARARAVGPEGRRRDAVDAARRARDAGAGRPAAIRIAPVLRAARRRADGRTAGPRRGGGRPADLDLPMHDDASDRRPPIRSCRRHRPGRRRSGTSRAK